MPDPAGVPNLQDLMPDVFGKQAGFSVCRVWGGADVIIIEIKCTISAMHLNHPKTILSHQVHGKTVFHETTSWCPKGWGPLWYRMQPACLHQSLYWWVDRTLLQVPSGPPHWLTRSGPGPWNYCTSPEGSVGTLGLQGSGRRGMGRGCSSSAW